MELLNGEIFGAFTALRELSEKELPVKVSFGLAKIHIAIGKEYEAIDKVRNDLIKKHGTPNKEKGGQVEVVAGTEAFEAYFEDLAELMKQTVEVEFEVVKLPQEIDGKPLQLPAKVLVALAKFVELDGAVPLKVVK